VINVARRAAMATAVGVQSGERRTETGAASSRRPPPPDTPTPVHQTPLVPVPRGAAAPPVQIPRMDPPPREPRPADPTLTSRVIEARRRTVPDPVRDLGSSSQRDSAASVQRMAPPQAVSSARGPNVRPFPERFAGKFKVRGPVLRSVDRGLIDLFGQRERDEVVRHMPGRYAADFVQGSLNAMVRYDLEALDAYMELATEILLHDVERWREIGRHAVGGELFNVVRSLLRPSPDYASLVRRGALIWAQLFSFGAWRASTGANGRALLQVADFEPASSSLRHWLAGMLEETARRAISPDAKVAITGGEMGFTPELTCEIS
jgi:serine/threonine-protein kinase